MLRALFLVICLYSIIGYSETTPPNFLLIVTDDQNVGTVNDKWMPNTKKLIFDQGISFRQAFISNPQCCPSRATILTGKYSRNNGQLSNEVEHNLQQLTCAYYLKQKGYRTGLVGKYLNSDSGSYDSYKQKQFDYWYASKKNNDFYSHLSAVKQNHQEHSSSWITTRVTEFLKVDSKQPFFLMVNFHAPHYLSKVDKSYQKLFKQPEESELDSSKPNYLNLAKDKPQWLRTKARTEPNKFLRHEKKSFYKLQVLDLKIAEIMAVLKEQQSLENTYIIYISDNGILFGQHGLNGKSLPYETAIHVPFAIKGPGVKPEVSEKLTGNLDIAPTIYALAGVANQDVDGINILKETRSYYLLEGGYHTRRSNQPRFRGVVNSKYRLFKTAGDVSELYDISSDPYQLNNLYNQSKHASVQVELEDQLEKFPDHNS